MERIKEHEYLLKEDHYQTAHVNKGRGNKICNHCKKPIPAGTPHDIHKFYPSFANYPVHTDCHDAFMKSLQL